MDIELAKWIIGGEAVAIAAMAAYIVKLWKDRDDERKARIRYLEDQNAIVNALSAASQGGPPSGQQGGGP
jgi:hypothetical protein